MEKKTSITLNERFQKMLGVAPETTNKFNGFASEADYQKVLMALTLSLSNYELGDLNGYADTLMVSQSIGKMTVNIDDYEVEIVSLDRMRDIATKILADLDDEAYADEVISLGFSAVEDVTGKTIRLSYDGDTWEIARTEEAVINELLSEAMDTVVEWYATEHRGSISCFFSGE